MLFNCINLYLNKALHFTFNYFLHILYSFSSFKSMLSFGSFYFFFQEFWTYLLSLSLVAGLVVENGADFSLVDWFARVVKFEFVFAPAHPKHFESINLGNELWRGRRHMLWIHLHKQKLRPNKSYLPSRKRVGN